jgi:hypothetical protein
VGVLAHLSVRWEALEARGVYGVSHRTKAVATQFAYPYRAERVDDVWGDVLAVHDKPCPSKPKWD